MCGTTQCGKTHFVRSMLHFEEELFDLVPTKIIHCCEEYQKGEKGRWANAKMHILLEKNVTATTPPYLRGHVGAHEHS